jgi:cell division protein FtsI/penicillin-binding protein 2
MRRRHWVAVAVGVPVALAIVVPLVQRSRRIATETPSIAKVSSHPAVEVVAPPPPPVLGGLDLGKLEVKDDGVSAPLGEKKIAKLTIDPALQRVADGLMKAYRLPEAAVVVVDVETGRVLAYASHVEKGPKRDLVVEATAPAASVFKIVTGTSLVENANFGPDDKQCYSGGEQRITMADLARDPKRDRWCTTLGGAMGRSINTVFARLALENLKPARLDETAHTLGFGAPLTFDVPVQPSAVHFPEDPLGFARTAAGFWNTTLSPLHAAWLGAAIARGGDAVRPYVVSEVVDDGKVTWTAPGHHAERRIMKPETAHAVTAMMDMTVSEGTSFRAFHDAKGTSFLPGVTVAGKTGTLTDAGAQRFYTWFAGFAPSKPVVFPADTVKDGHDPAQPRKVAFGVLVVNEPKWTIKANVLAREVLRAYFAGEHVPGVTSPRPSERADQAREGSPSATSTTPATKHRRQRGS